MTFVTRVIESLAAVFVPGSQDLLEKENESNVHCFPDDLYTINSLCPRSDFIVNPNRQFYNIRNDEFSKDDNSENLMHIRPQRVKIKLRKGEKYDFKFQYKQPSNYPVDLYYIMDLSFSMKNSKNTLENLGGALIKKMREKTKNFRIGFGSFVDKVTLPFVNTYPTALKIPCSECAPPFGFRNDLSLTNSSTEFSKKISETQISGNIDSPEGGLDALMQAMVCDDIIGWRQDARRLVVLSTDATPHIAGDGKLGGVVEPNDLKCHMEGNYYTESLRLDYPSLAQVNYIARKNDMHIIFAVSEKPLIYYKLISGIIQNSKVGKLKDDSRNIVQFISDIYDEIRETVRITSNATSDVKLEITSNCEKDSTKVCSVQPGHIVDFSLSVQPMECSEDSSKNKKYIKVKPEGLKDSLVIELDVICDCDCSSKKINNAGECNYQGDLDCGVCKCKQDRFGKNCQCDRSTSSTDDIQSCIKSGDSDVCSGQGTCICGNCICNKRSNSSEIISGKFCECNNYSCKKDCSGHGVCECGVCKCHKDYVGDSCECALSTSSCIAPNSKQICSGYGECHCGSCICFQDKNKRFGKHCEECITCPSQKCEEFRPCVDCQAYKSGGYNETQCTEICTQFQAVIVEKLSGGSIKEGINYCQFLDERGCTMEFEYEYVESSYYQWIVQALKDKKCPEPITIWYISTLCLEVIGSILLIGLLTLIGWKGLVTYHDKKEYAKFEKEKTHAKWVERNPIYKEVKSTFTNPVYGRPEDD